MPASPPQEIAALEVNGQILTNWKSVNVQHRWSESFHIFEFSTVEPVPAPASFMLMQPNIGDQCTFTLAGITAITGYVITRQSAMDANSHGIQIIGKTSSFQMTKSSIRTETGSFDGQTLPQIAATICAQEGVGVGIVGAVDPTPFKSCQHSPGENSFSFLEHLAPERGAILGSNSHGDLLLIGLHGDPNDNDQFIEGINIERINVIWSNEYVYANMYAVGQQPGDDQTFGVAASEMQAGPVPAADPRPSVLVVPQEHPDSPQMLKLRAAFEARWHAGTQLTVTVVVQGWLRANGDLWRVGNLYFVTAPSHLLDNVGLKAQTVTFEQSEEGTSTTLVLVLPWFLNGLFSTRCPGATCRDGTAVWRIHASAAASTAAEFVRKVGWSRA
jgi:prophage tail gpP-like protein